MTRENCDEEIRGKLFPENAGQSYRRAKNPATLSQNYGSWDERSNFVESRGVTKLFNLPDDMRFKDQLSRDTIHLYKSASQNDSYDGDLLIHTMNKKNTYPPTLSLFLSLFSHLSISIYLNERAHRFFVLGRC